MELRKGVLYNLKVGLKGRERRFYFGIVIEKNNRYPIRDVTNLECAVEFFRGGIRIKNDALSNTII
jgi:hypothetical protein